MRARMGAQTHDEYIMECANAGLLIDAAVCASDPANARTALSEARAALSRADSRLSAHAAPPR